MDDGEFSRIFLFLCEGCVFATIDACGLVQDKVQNEKKVKEKGKKNEGDRRAKDVI